MSGNTEETEEDLGTAEELLSSSDDEASDNDPLRQESIRNLVLQETMLNLTT